MVTNAILPRSGTSNGVSLNSVCGSEVLPDQRGAHAHPDAERGQPVTRLRALAESVRELGEKPDAGGRQRVAARDRAAVRVEALVLRVDAETVAPAQNLDREGLVQLEQPEL